ncbi:DNA/RNA non-specific endonuclease [Costertonia aggregata]|uniref:Endonuclease n=1 Tax=Costertonia aggregata TaxID=343403 RepID=A0A7H9ARE3_9FLAO|nr:DNA/RNA non-specific endonuclease [Costertonia aggregata]QLG45805.1 DNA/RNA non-specific endonuclease [Costertonia aggregata]
MKRRNVYTLLILVCIVGFWLFENFYTPDTYSDTTADQTGFKRAMLNKLMPTSTTGAIVSHNYYMLSYNEPYEQAEWVAYYLKREHLTNDDRKRPYFIEDPKVKTKSADWRNYKGSGYDRGHLCPAGDRRFSEQAYNETFYTSNISPQNREFNAGVWNRLEMQTRFWAKQHGELLVVTGGVLEKGLEEIGEEDVDVPQYFYKVISRGKGNNIKAVGFLMRNAPSDIFLESFLVPIDVIEKKTGIDFFPNLSDGQQSDLEGSVKKSGWEF